MTPGPVWTVAGNMAPTGLRSPDRPARSESLYRLSFPGPHSDKVKGKVHPCTGTEALTGRTAHRGSRGLALLFLYHGTRSG